MADWSASGGRASQRALIRSHWRMLGLGMLAGSVTSMMSSWALATALGLNDLLRLSFLPRSISTPFAMTISGEIGGAPDSTARRAGRRNHVGPVSNPLVAGARYSPRCWRARRWHGESARDRSRGRLSGRLGDGSCGAVQHLAGAARRHVREAGLNGKWSHEK